MSSTYVPPSTTSDARNRAFRTFFQGLLVDVGAVVAALLVVALGDVQWTQTYWVGIASLVGKTVITSVVAYIARRAVPPPQ